MRYFFHKLGKGNRDVGRFLGDAQAGDSGRIAIYFGHATMADCLAGKHGKDAQDFCLAGQNAAAADARVVLVANREFWVLEPAGAVTECGVELNGEGESNLVKVMPIKVLVRKPVTQVPHLLASMASNAYWSRGTFREIGKAPPPNPSRLSWDGWPHHFAIELQLPPAFRRFPSLVPDGPHLLRLLSSVELETLVAKIFEEAGCFVPAYRGGTMADIDILAHNIAAQPIRCGPVNIAAGQSIGIQVKSWMKDPPRAVPGVLLVSLNLHRDDRADHWDAAKLWHALESAHQTTAWLRRSLTWIQADNLV